MPNQENSRNAADTFFPVTSSALLYGGRERVMRPVPSRSRPQKALGPDAIWGQFNNYRSNGLAGSAAVHIVLLALILASATLGHQVVQKVQEHETVTLIAPSPDSYALPVAKKVASGGGGGGIGGGVFKVGGGISAPQALSAPDPEYTEEARNAKTQGTCILWLIVDDQGHPRDIRVVRGLGFGLDTKAVEAVKQWRFQPALKDGRPVNVQISVEVGFRLY